MNIQWYPGHMTKAVRMMEENMKLIDLVIELIDARIPVSSRNPDIDRLAGNKMRLVILNKSDLADEKENKKWIRYFEERKIAAICYNSKSRDGIGALNRKLEEVCKEKKERDRKRGIINRSVKAMIVGIPNVGKSTFINNLAKRNAAVVGNKPGVTKGKQWIRIGKELDLLDTPGILWPKFEDNFIGMHIGYIGSINDEIISLEELSTELIKELRNVSPDALKNRYGETISEDLSAPEVLEAIAVARKCYKKGEVPDLKKAADLFLDDFRSGKLGRITLEDAPENSKVNSEPVSGN